MVHETERTSVVKKIQAMEDQSKTERLASDSARKDLKSKLKTERSKFESELSELKRLNLDEVKKLKQENKEAIKSLHSRYEAEIKDINEKIEMQNKTHADFQQKVIEQKEKSEKGVKELMEQISNAHHSQI